MKDNRELLALEKATDLFVAAMGRGEWESRRSEMLNHMRNTHRPFQGKVRELMDDESRIAFDNDPISWYLLLAESYVSETHEYDFLQGARVIPILARIGESVDFLKSTGRADEKIREVVAAGNRNPDSALFEILVALAYKRNGWPKVEFLAETPPKRRPDLRVSGPSGKLFVECKRMSKSSQYSLDERAKWLQMWRPVAEFLKRERLPLLLDITFHQELRVLADTFLADELLPKLALVATSCVLVDNSAWTVSVEYVSMDEVRKRQNDMLVKIGSPSLVHTVTGGFDPAKGCTLVLEASHAPGKPSYVDGIHFAAAAVWYCDAPEAARRKARHIKKLVADAVDQLPQGEFGVVHAGLESHDGAIVEDVRRNRIAEELKQFNMGSKMLAFIYVHVFDPRVTPEKAWDFGETVNWFSSLSPGHEPLRQPLLVPPDEATAEFRAPGDRGKS